MSPIVRTAAAILALGLLAAGLSACARAPMAPAQETLAPLALETFFRGTTVGEGRFESGIGGVDRSFTLTTRGRWDGRTLTLREDFVFDDGERQTLTWRFRKVGEGRFEGTREDVIGTADVRTEGNTIRMSYDAVIGAENGSGGTRVHFEDVLFLSGPNEVVNKAVVSRFGIPVGTVEVTFRRR